MEMRSVLCPVVMEVRPSVLCPVVMEVRPSVLCPVVMEMRPSVLCTVAMGMRSSVLCPGVMKVLVSFYTSTPQETRTAALNIFNVLVRVLNFNILHKVQDGQSQAFSGVIEVLVVIFLQAPLETRRGRTCIKK